MLIFILLLYQAKSHTMDVLILNSYYYFTRDLKHNNGKSVLFPNFNTFPFSTTGSNTINFQIGKNGHYHIIFTDSYKNSGTFAIYETNAKNTLFQLTIGNSSDWKPIIINAVIKVSIPQNYAYANLHFGFRLNDSAILDGVGYSTFFIKYIK